MVKSMHFSGVYARYAGVTAAMLGLIYAASTQLGMIYMYY